MFKERKELNRPLQTGLNLHTPALSKISMDFKYMPCSSKQYRYIFVLLCEVTNFIIALPLKTTQAADVCTAILEGHIKSFGSHAHIICDEDPVFMSCLEQYFFQQLGFKIVTHRITFHKSLFAEHSSQNLSNVLMKHLSGLGCDWDSFFGQDMLKYSSYTYPNMNGLSPLNVL